MTIWIYRFLLPVIFIFAFSSLKAETIKMNITNYVHPGRYFTAEIEGNPTTGYDWNVRLTGDNILQEITNYYIQIKTTKTGAPWNKIWKWRAFSKGKVKLDFLYYRSWEGETNAIQTNSLWLIVR